MGAKFGHAVIIKVTLVHKWESVSVQQIKLLTSNMEPVFLGIPGYNADHGTGFVIELKEDKDVKSQ